MQRTVRNLVRKIQALKITIYEKELNEKQIELEFAQEQIRPHFFLNCISLIHGIVMQICVCVKLVKAIDKALEWE